MSYKGKSREHRDIGELSITTNIVNAWNKLPDEMIRARNLILFEKKQLDKF